MRKPEALWFGRRRRRCFGMLHQPDAPSIRGVVFCNAFGFEGLLSYRAYRHLADGVAARGHWALRFDYDGEGDSAGGQWEPHRVDAWMASIDAAVSVLRSRGVTEIRLVGFRIGAHVRVPLRDHARRDLRARAVGAVRSRRGLRPRATRAVPAVGNGAVRATVGLGTVPAGLIGSRRVRARRRDAPRSRRHRSPRRSVRALPARGTGHRSRRRASRR